MVLNRIGGYPLRRIAERYDTATDLQHFRFIRHLIECSRYLGDGRIVFFHRRVWVILFVWNHGFRLLTRHKSQCDAVRSSARRGVPFKDSIGGYGGNVAVVRFDLQDTPH